MAVDPEVIPSSSSAGQNAVRFLPRWLLYMTVGIVVIFLVLILKTVLPLMAMGLLLLFIYKQDC